MRRTNDGTMKINFMFCVYLMMPGFCCECVCVYVCVGGGNINDCMQNKHSHTLALADSKYTKETHKNGGMMVKFYYHK